MEFSKFEKYLLINFNKQHLEPSSQNERLDLDHEFLNVSADGGEEYYNTLFRILQELLILNRDNEPATVQVQQDEVDDGDVRRKQQENLFLTGIWLTKFFIQLNYTGPLVQVDSAAQAFLDSLSVLEAEMVLDGEAVIDNVRHPVSLFVAKEILKKVDPAMYPSVDWWILRINFLHEKILDEKSNVLWTEMKNYEEKLLKTSSVNEDKSLGVHFYLELSHMYLYHYDITTAKNLVSKAANEAGVAVSLTGALGKRTRYQQKELAQLIVQVQSLGLSSAFDEVTFHLLPDHLPKNLALNDDTRLNKIQLSEKSEDQNLNNLQLIILLNFFFVRKSFYPLDDVSLSECQAFISALLSTPKVWAVQCVALLNRSLIETTNSRTVGRSMEQLEVLKEGFSRVAPKSYLRLPYFFSSHMPMWFQLEAGLAEVYKSLGSINSALDVYLRLNMWDSAIDCYHSLQLRHKAEEIIRKELEKGESVKLWCHLGDATDNPEYYEKAWILSKEKSSRVQRQWGYLFYHQKKYEEALPHLEKAVALNPLEYPVWMRLAYTAMQASNWELCAKAYRHACVLDSDNFESWNNLANAYLKLKDKPRAMKVLIEATKCDFNVWQVWDNLLVVATDCRVFDDAIRSYNRLLDLKGGKHVDVEVLVILKDLICQNLEDAFGVGCMKYHKAALKLLGRITASVTTNGALWKIYSDLLVAGEELETGENRTSVLYRSVEYAQKSVRCLTQDPKWDKVVENIKSVVEYALNLGRRTLEFIRKCPSSPAVPNFKGTAVLTVNKVLTSLQKLKKDSILMTDVYDKSIQELQECLKDLSSAVKTPVC